MYCDVCGRSCSEDNSAVIEDLITCNTCINISEQEIEDNQFDDLDNLPSVEKIRRSRKNEED